LKKVNINKHKINIKKTLFILISFITGISISTYLKSINSNNIYITLEQKRYLERDIENIELEISNLEKLKVEYEKKLNNYKEFYESESKSVEELMEEELKELKEISGNFKLTGPGVIITIKDSDRELRDGENPNDLVVHDIDILRIINDLKGAGAKGITINNERVLTNSQIKCSGATITVNETTYGQPFVIKAVGDKQSLIKSINSANSYTNLLREIYGIYIKVESNDDISLNFYENSK